VNGPNCREGDCALKYRDPVPSSRSPNPPPDAGGVRTGGPTSERGFGVGGGLNLSAGNVGGRRFGAASPCPSGALREGGEMGDVGELFPIGGICSAEECPAESGSGLPSAA
jgi:hypothetical protein